MPNKTEPGRALLARSASVVEERLLALLPPTTAPPEVIHQAMHHAVFGRGKRLRPTLAIAAAEAIGRATDGIISAACGLELIHTYSLVHDDLPALDDDDLRRGRPTTHRLFGEAMAILAGDALLTLGLEVLAAHPEEASTDSRIEVVLLVSRAVGTLGMIGGQVDDLLATEATSTTRSPTHLEAIHARKTGALITASLLVGAIHAGASSEQLKLVRGFGRHLGLAFQIADDILDVVGSAESLGKSPGKDSDQGKLTWPGLHGLEASRETLERETRRAIAVATELDPSGQLASLAALIGRRKS